LLVESLAAGRRTLEHRGRILAEPRKAVLARRIAAGDPAAAPPARPRRPDAGDPLPAILTGRARRARECLLFLADHPDSSNRETAAGIGVAHEPQISKVLRSLAKDNLVAKSSDGVGRRNAWRLTPRGEEMQRAVQQTD
jgi:hypothetical protein